jgi:DNA-binding response OmpR family regulator
MGLRSLLLSSDDDTVRILRRVLSDLEISVEHCRASDAAVRQLTRQRFEAIVVDCSDLEEARGVLRSAKASPANNRAVAIVLVSSAIGLRGGFDMGAHFVLHKPLTRERARSSFRAVRALMKRERRRQVRVAVQVPVECRGFGSAIAYRGKTLDLCEGGMAVQFTGRVVRDNSFRFSLELPGMETKLELEGELAWDGGRNESGIRFKNMNEEQQITLRHWLNNQLPEPEQDDPPVTCRLSDLSLGGCYLETVSPFPVGTRITLSMKSRDCQAQASGAVRIMHPEHGMGVEFIQTTQEQRDRVHQMIDALRANGEQSTELLVEPDSLEPIAGSDGPVWSPVETEDSLVELFRNQNQVPVEAFLQQLRQQRHAPEPK